MTVCLSMSFANKWMSFSPVPNFRVWRCINATSKLELNPSRIRGSGGVCSALVYAGVPFLPCLLLNMLLYEFWQAMKSKEGKKE